MSSILQPREALNGCGSVAKWQLFRPSLATHLAHRDIQFLLHMWDVQTIVLHLPGLLRLCGDQTAIPGSPSFPMGARSASATSPQRRAGFAFLGSISQPDNKYKKLQSFWESGDDWIITRETPISDQDPKVLGAVQICIKTERIPAQKSWKANSCKVTVTPDSEV